MRFHPLHLAGAAALALAPALALAGNDAAATITGGEIKDHIGFLASDALEGRGTGTDGERAAGEYIARLFAKVGLEPAGEDGGYFQPFSVADGGEVAAGAKLRIERGPFSREFAVGEDAQAFSFSASGKVDAPLVFAGYGITDPQSGWDDYAGLDVKGKAVLVLRHEARRGGRNSRHAFFTTKAANARAHGAAALLIVTGPRAEVTDELVPFQGGGDELLPAFHLKQSLVAGLFKLAGKDLAEVQRTTDETMKPITFDLGARVQLDVSIRRKVLTARNVIGRLVGSDPTLKDEVVVVGAHYDHVGKGGPGVMDRSNVGSIHNGADDNASGTSGMLEIAQAFAGSGQRPKRTILFMAYSGEERGLLGSQHWCAHPTVALEKVVAMVNLDMIGRLRAKEFEVGGIGTSPGMEAIVKAALAAEGLEASLDPSGQGPSDHASFDDKKIPVLFFFTGLHDDYHRPGDDVEKINFEGAAKVARAAFSCLSALADLPARPPYTEVKQAGPNANRPRLGVMLDRNRTEGGVGVQSVVPDGPAAKAGVLADDLIVGLAGKEIKSFQDLTQTLGAQQFDAEVDLVVQRGDQRLTLKVKLTRPPQ